jgi:hypothetical protein
MKDSVSGGYRSSPSVKRQRKRTLSSQSHMLAAAAPSA